MSSINGFSSFINLPQFDASRADNDKLKKGAGELDPGFSAGFGRGGVGNEIGFTGEYKKTGHGAERDPGFKAGFGKGGVGDEIGLTGEHKKTGHGADELDPGFNAGFSRQRSWA
ncbi:hypothetical protein [Pseudomonas sp. L1(2025)]|uniref:hypothetical protein n=1 Tax=Pseudomonas sp. L1(2025) TaxID=3449429 RepID=UPI003F6917D7